MVPQKMNQNYHVLQQFHSNITHGSQKIKRPKCPLMDGQMHKLRYVYE